MKIFNVFDASGTLVHIDDKGTGTKTDYVKGAGMTLAHIKNGAVSYLHPDHLGSAYSATDASDTVLWREYYTPFGMAKNNPASNDNQAGFTATAVTSSGYNQSTGLIIWLRQPPTKHIKDAATGLNYMQARYYDPVMGRFLSVDPVGFTQDGRTGMFNRYAYTLNNPVNLIDPDGMQVKELEKGKEYSFTAKIQNESSQEMSKEQLQSIGDDIASVIDDAFSGSKGLFRGDVSMESDISVGEATEGQTQISIVDSIMDANGNIVLDALGSIEGNFGEGGDLKVTTLALEKVDEGRTGGHEFGHSFGDLGHPRRTSFTLMDQTNRSKSKVLRPDQRRKAIKNFRRLQKND